MGRLDSIYTCRFLSPATTSFFSLYEFHSLGNTSSIHNRSILRYSFQCDITIAPWLGVGFFCSRRFDLLSLVCAGRVFPISSFLWILI
jgi:hypothetical protein